MGGAMAALGTSEYLAIRTPIGAIAGMSGYGSAATTTVPALESLDWAWTVGAATEPATATRAASSVRRASLRVCPISIPPVGRRPLACLTPTIPDHGQERIGRSSSLRLPLPPRFEVLPSRERGLRASDRLLATRLTGHVGSYLS